MPGHTMTKPRHEKLFGAMRVDGALAALTLVGEIDVTTLSRFQALMDALIAVHPGRITIDMAGVDYVGVCAVPVLEGVAKLLSGTGGSFSLRNVPPGAHRLFSAAGLYDGIEVEAAEDNAFIVRGIAKGGVPPERQVLDTALKLVVTMAQAVVAGADGVSITLPRHGRLGTVAASNDVVLEMDHDQYETGEGPCLDAATQGARFFSDDLADEERWPAFVPRARARGIESILSTPLLRREAAIGALNIYSRSVGAFAAHEKEWANQFAAEASHVVSACDAAPAGLPFDAQILQALEARESIAMATGIVMHRDGASRGDADTFLRDMSRRTSRPMREVCDALVTSLTSLSRRPVTEGGHVDRTG
jgi:anti-anti-sigma factor